MIQLSENLSIIQQHKVGKSQHKVNIMLNAHHFILFNLFSVMIEA